MPTINDPIYNTAAPRINNEYGFPVREDVAFSNAKGEAKAAIEKDFRKIIAPIASPLQRLLEPGETIFWGSKAVPPVGILEQLTMGWVMYAYFRVALVLTDRRLLVFGITSSGKWRGSIKSVRWNQLTSATATGWLTQGLKLKMGKKTFLYGKLGMAYAKKIKGLLPFLMPAVSAMNADPMALQQMESLCGRCCRPLVPKVYTCANCGLTFKSEKTLAVRTLIPGGAYFYTGLTGVGILNALVESFFWLALLGNLLEPDAHRNTAASGIVIGYLLFLIALEKLIAYSHGKLFVRQFEPANFAELNIPAAMSATAR
jgi:hypothetical protein